ncbi:MAG TPA: Ku protein [Methylocella sp.]|nr:Ku protein [Methylocella sp.]
MPPRANWKGYLKLSLVTCSVELFPATSDKEKVSFHLLNSATGHRLKQQYVDNETGRVVDRDNRVKGYEVAKDDYVIVSDEELAAIEIESTHTIDIEKFVARSEVDQVFLDKPYFIVPDDKVGQEAFGVIREAMSQLGVAGIARVALHGRERLILLEPRANGIMGTTLHHNYEVRSDSVYFDDIPDLEIGKELLDLASHIIETKKASFDPEKFKDRYQDAVVDLIHSKRAGRPVQVTHVPPPGNVINLMDALRRSLGPEKSAQLETKKSRPAALKPKPGRRAAARRKSAPSKGRIKKAS